MRVLKIAMLCLPVLAWGAAAVTPDPDPAHWQKVSIQVQDRAIGFAVPHGYRFEGNDPRPRSLAVSEATGTTIFDAQYEHGNGWSEADLPQFTVFFMLLPYSGRTADVVAGLRQIAQSPDETPDLQAGQKPPRPGTSSEVVKVAERSFVLVHAPKGTTSYAMPFSKTHAFFVVAEFLARTPHDEAWFEARRKILQDIARSVTITKSPGQ
jgi:hypothetical protein